MPRAGGGVGAIDVRLSSGARQHVTQAQLAGLPPAGRADRFGESLAFIRADRDYCTALAIGVPGADGGRGAVVIAKGSTSGVAAAGAVRITGSTPGEGFGFRMAAVGTDLFVAAPGHSVSGRPRAGAIDHYRVGADGVPVLLETVTESTSGVPGVAEQDDRFGEVLEAVGTGDTWVDESQSHVGHIGLVVGEPSEDAGSRRDAGSVTVLSFSTSTHRLSLARSLSQDMSGVGGVGEAGDRFGASVSFDMTGGVGFLAVGVPGEDIGSAADAGMVQVFTGVTGTTLRQAQSLTQGSPHVPGGIEPGDRFGASVAVGRFADCVAGTNLDIAVGAPGEALGSRRDAGTVTLLPLGATGTYAAPCRHAWYQGSGGLGGTAEAGDQLGTTLAASTDPDMYLEDEPQWSRRLVGVPGEDVGTLQDVGGVHELAVSGKVLVDTFGDSAGRAAGARYGSVFARRPDVALRTAAAALAFCDRTDACYARARAGPSERASVTALTMIPMTLPTAPTASTQRTTTSHGSPSLSKAKGKACQNRTSAASPTLVTRISPAARNHRASTSA